MKNTMIPHKLPLHDGQIFDYHYTFQFPSYIRQEIRLSAQMWKVEEIIGMSCQRTVKIQEEHFRNDIPMEINMLDSTGSTGDGNNFGEKFGEKQKT